MARSLVSPEVASLRPYEPGKPIDEVRRELGIEHPVKLASNENAWGPSPAAVKAIAEAAKEVHLYPDGAAFHLRAALSEHLGVEPARIVFGNGSNELIELVVRAFVLAGDNVVTSALSFVAYKIATLAAGREFREAAVGEGLGVDLEAVLARCDERTRVIFLANPNNPTGAHIEAAALEAFVAALDARFGDDPPVLVLDEAYLEYVDSPAHPDAIALVRRRPRTVTLRTFSKAYGLAGARCGYAVTSPELADFLNRIRAPFNLSSLAQAGALAALGDQEHMTAAVAETLTERERVTAALKELGFRVVPSQANFVLVDFQCDALALHGDLMKRGVITRPMRPYGLDQHLRVTIGRPEENDSFLEALAASFRRDEG